MRLQSNWPGFQEFQAFMAEQMGGENNMEIVPIARYDTLMYPLAGTLGLLFFATGQGAGLSTQDGASGAGQSKTLRDTNLQANGQLPAPQGFFATSLELHILPGSSAAANTWAHMNPSYLIAVPTQPLMQKAADDISAIASTGAVQLLINGREYAQDTPILQFPPQRHVELISGLSTNSATTTTILKETGYVAGPLNTFNPGIRLQNGVNFNVALSWDALKATPSGFNAKIVSRLNGWHFRSKSG